MSQICTIPPVELAVTLAEAKRNLRVDDDHLDELITTWLQGIIAALEHEIDQCLMPQTWTVTLPAFSDAIRLPHPVMRVEAVRYLDSDGVRQDLAPASWYLSRDRYRSVMALAPGAAWPATSRGDDALIITVVCGHGESAENTPANVRLYILAKLAEQFDPATRLERDTVQSKFVDRLLDACRSYA